MFALRNKQSARRLACRAREIAVRAGRSEPRIPTTPPPLATAAAPALERAAAAALPGFALAGLGTRVRFARNERVRRGGLELAPQVGVVDRRRAKLTDEVHQRLALARKGMARSRRLFRHRRVLLRQLVHAADRPADFTEASRLVLRIGRDSRDEVADLRHPRVDRVESLAGLGHHRDALADLRSRFRHQLLDFFRGLRASLRQSAHLRSDDRKAASGVAGSRRLDARVEREKVGLEGNLVDHRDDIADLSGRRLDATHRLDGVLDDFRPPIGVQLGALYGLFGLRCAARGLIDVVGYAAQGGRGLFETGGLICRAPSEVARGL